MGRAIQKSSRISMLQEHLAETFEELRYAESHTLKYGARRVHELMEEIDATKFFISHAENEEALAIWEGR